MANLPNKPFVFNYNARDYNPTTRTIQRTSGQTLALDMVWSGTTQSVIDNITYTDDHLNIPTSAFSVFNFSTSEANPVNITTLAPSMTLIVKFKRTGGGTNIIANRGSTTYNWMARQGTTLSFHTANSNTNAGQTVPCTDGSVITAVYRINNQVIEIINLTTGEKNTPFTASWHAAIGGFVFFAGSTALSGEFMAGDFYWCYASREVLTDEEIQQVVRYNDSKFGPDTTGTTIAASGGTATANIDSETGWTATTTSPWITISPASGDSGTTAITFTIKKNMFSARTGVVTFTSDAGDVAEYTITQKGQDKVVPINKMYQGTRRIN